MFMIHNLGLITNIAGYDMLAGKWRKDINWGGKMQQFVVQNVQCQEHVISPPSNKTHVLTICGRPVLSAKSVWYLQWHKQVNPRDYIAAMIWIGGLMSAFGDILTRTKITHIYSS